MIQNLPTIPFPLPPDIVRPLKGTVSNRSFQGLFTICGLLQIKKELSHMTV